MQMASVQMSRHHDLEPVSPHFLCECNADGVALIRRDLAGFEALIPVPRNIVVVLAVFLFRQDHLPEGNILLTVDCGDILPAFGFDRVQCVLPLLPWNAPQDCR